MDEDDMVGEPAGYKSEAQNMAWGRTANWWEGLTFLFLLIVSFLKISREIGESMTQNSQTVTWSYTSIFGYIKMIFQKDPAPKFILHLMCQKIK